MTNLPLLRSSSCHTDVLTPAKNPENSLRGPTSLRDRPADSMRAKPRSELRRRQQPQELQDKQPSCAYCGQGLDSGETSRLGHSMPTEWHRKGESVALLSVTA
ncbi:hypothetical protein H920_12785 [Fukomys damarensis]|uniref:Uncharacterized protein n=1 Tax=Fukomys damarensis TaxID=885580 RepID=A0A091D4A4_FUKDA|nr:hypothetical protein H920_12785 [Fukomys damarensis]